MKKFAMFLAVAAVMGVSSIAMAQGTDHVAATEAVRAGTGIFGINFAYLGAAIGIGLTVIGGGVGIGLIGAGAVNGIQEPSTEPLQGCVIALADHAESDLS